MYEYVTYEEVREYRSQCSNYLEKLRDWLFEEDINSQPVLVGSGAKNMVTRNGNGPYDLDYNLRILDMPDEYRDNPGRLKELIRRTLSSIVGSSFSDGKDSTSVITCIKYDMWKGVSFKFDVAILFQNEHGHWCRLVHDKQFLPFENQYILNEVPYAHNVSQKVKAIKEKRKWHLVRERYLKKKNLYLEKNDHDHPSFICYIEAVNEVYRNLK